MGKKTGRIILDAALTIMIVFEMLIQYTGEFLHEVIGFAFFATVIAHLILSAKWIRGTAQTARKGSLKGRRLGLAIMGILLAVAMIALGVSSVAISNLLYSAGFVWTLGSYDLWVVVHTISSYALCALVAVHLAMHWAFLFSAFKVPYDPERRQAISTGVHVVAAVGAVALGVAAAREVMPQSLVQGETVQQRERERFASATDIEQDESSANAASPSSSSSSSPTATSPSSKKDKRSNAADARQSSGAADASAKSSTEIENDSEPPAASPSEEEMTADSSAPTGICTLCRKNCPLSAPKCDKPYKAGLI